MNGQERRIYFYDLAVGTNKEAAVSPPLPEVARVIEMRFRQGRTTHAINKSTAVLEVGDIRIDHKQEIAVFLLRISDKSAPDPYLSNPEKKRSRVIRKEEGEGRGYGAHLVLSLREDEKRPNHYLALLEKNIGLHRHHVARLLQAILRVLYKEDETVFTCDDVNGARDREKRPKKVGFRPMLSFSGHPSETLVEELEKGSLKDIILIHDEKKVQIGGRPWLHARESQLKLKANSKSKIRKAWEEVKSIIGDNARKYEKARIRFINTDGDSQTVEIDSETGNTLLDERYVKSRNLKDIIPQLDESSDHIVDHLADKMIELLLENR